MAEPFEKILLSNSEPAAADLNASQYLFVKDNGSDKLIVCTSLGEFSKGVLQNDPNTDEQGEYAQEGYTRVRAAGALAVDTVITTDANGRAVAAAVTHIVAGVVVVAAGAVDEIATIKIMDPTIF